MGAAAVAGELRDPALVHALVAGQTPKQQLLTSDWTRLPASALGSLVDSA